MPRMIFVLGCAHSGTTLLATILGANSQCFLIPTETRIYESQNDNWPKKYFVDQINQINYKFVIEKTPGHIFKIENIKKNFSDALFIISVRNPIDIVGSIKNRGEDFSTAIYQCSNDLSGCRFAINKENTIIVEYENIIENFDKTISDLCNFIGISFEENMKNFHENSPVWFEKSIESDYHLKRRSEQMRQPLFDGRGVGYESLTLQEKDQVVFDCSEKYLQITGKVLTKEMPWSKI